MSVELRSPGFSIGPLSQTSQEASTFRAPINIFNLLGSSTEREKTFTVNNNTYSSEPITSLNMKSILGINLGVQHTLMGHGYDFELYIVNSSGKALPISPTAVQNFTIVDDMARCWAEGSITIAYDNEWLEYISQFPFRNDGEDFLRFRLIPLNNNEYNTSLNLSKKIWELNYIFSIYDIHDVTPKTRSNSDSSTIKKLKKFFFRDVRHYFLQAQNIEYSTAQSKNAPINSLPTDFANRYSDENRSILTGVCLDEYIKKSFNNDPTLSLTGRDINPREDWDNGSTNLFYTSGARENCLEGIKSILDRHVSETGPDCCIMGIERNEGGIGYITLKPLSRFFSRAGSKYDVPGPDQIEHFFLKQDFSKEDTSATRRPRAPILRDAAGNPANDMVRDIKINDFNSIDKYEFVDISPQINSSFLNKQPVYSFDFNKRQFNVEFNPNTIDFVQQFIKEKYISNLYKGRGDNNFLTPNITPTKLANKNITPLYSLYGDSNDQYLRLPDGLLKMLKMGVLQNTCINFTVPGLTFRRSGKFIGIDRLTGSEDNILDNKLCGQWLIVDVQHIIAAGNYYNNITAVKIHRYA
jgi:hypothetical protein